MKEYFNFHKIKTHILKYILKHDVSHRESHCIITFYMNTVSDRVSCIVDLKVDSKPAHSIHLSGCIIHK